MTPPMSDAFSSRGSLPTTSRHAPQDSRTRWLAAAIHSRMRSGCWSTEATTSLTTRAEGGKTMARKHWLAAYGPKIPCEINPDAHGSVLAMIEAAMRRFAERPAFRCFGHTLNYADTDRLSRSFAAFLQNKLRVKKGARIPGGPRGS